jgi:macrophage erythroblast attacher
LIFAKASCFTVLIVVVVVVLSQHLVDTGVFEVCQKVEDGLRNCVTGPCLAWCHDNRSKLRRLKSTLEYRIRLQDFTELVRQDRRMEAVKYARKYLSNGNEDMKQDLKSAMGLLAFSPQTSSKKYKVRY